MNLLDTLLNAQGGNAVRMLADKFGLDENQASSAISALLPALSDGLQNKASLEGGLEGLFGALAGGNHARFVDDPSALAHEDATTEGNGILGHLLGSKDASREVAATASEQTGISHEVLKGMLPIVASMAMGALSKQASTGSEQEQPQANMAEGLMGVLSGWLKR